MKQLRTKKCPFQWNVLDKFPPKKVQAIERPEKGHHC